MLPLVVNLIFHSSVNPINWKIIDYGVCITEFPAVLETDGAGVLESVGSEVTAFKKGDKIFFQGKNSPDATTFQQYTLVDTEVISKPPKNISDDQAITIPLASVTSVIALFQKSNIDFPENGSTTTGKPVFILGGSSSVGQYAIQLARIAGFSPIVTTASSQHIEYYLKSLGVNQVFGRNVNAKTIQGAFPTPVSLVFNTISAPATQELAVEILTIPSVPPCAHLAIFLPINTALKEKAEGKVLIHQVAGSSHMFKDLSVPYWQTVGKWMEEGNIAPNRVQVVSGGLSGVAEALDLSRKGVSGMKLVIHPQE